MSDQNSGDWNSGNWNSGDQNSGDQNSGNWNSGYRNSGYRNSGDWNSGNWNSGDQNSGYRNSGDWNSGDWNSGNWNSGDRNSGYLNTQSNLIYVFNKPCDFKEWINAEKPNFMFFDLNIWVTMSDMTDKEKEENPAYKTIEGYLKTIGYKDAWRNAWLNANDEDKELLYKLPNFCKVAFKELSGIDIDAKDKITITVNGKEVELSEETIKELKEKLGK